MSERATIVLDVGKTLSKLSLWTAGRTAPGAPDPPESAHRHSGCQPASRVGWRRTLREFASLAHVGSLIPVSHGAAAAVIRDGTVGPGAARL